MNTDKLTNKIDKKFWERLADEFVAFSSYKDEKFEIECKWNENKLIFNVHRKEKGNEKVRSYTVQIQGNMLYFNMSEELISNGKEKTIFRLFLIEYLMDKKKDMLLVTDMDGLMEQMWATGRRSNLILNHFQTMSEQEKIDIKFAKTNGKEKVDEVRVVIEIQLDVMQKVFYKSQLLCSLLIYIDEDYKLKFGTKANENLLVVDAETDWENIYMYVQQLKKERIKVLEIVGEVLSKTENKQENTYFDVNNLGYFHLWGYHHLLEFFLSHDTTETKHNKWTMKLNSELVENKGIEECYRLAADLTNKEKEKKQLKSIIKGKDRDYTSKLFYYLTGDIPVVKVDVQGDIDKKQLNIIIEKAINKGEDPFLHFKSNQSANKESKFEIEIEGYRFYRKSINYSVIEVKKI